MDKVGIGLFVSGGQFDPDVGKAISCLCGVILNRLWKPG